MTAKGTYAKGTKIDVEKTQAQIQTLVRRHGATMFTAGWHVGGGAAVEFTIHGRRVRWNVPAVPEQQSGAARSAEEKRRWRCLLLGIRAKLEIVASGISVFEKEFLAHVITTDGSTVWDRVMGTKMLGPVEKGSAEKNGT
jgi:hypothetical protein